MKYNPKPIDILNEGLSPELLQLTELLARNTHDNWALARLSEGWTYGPKRDDFKKETPNLVPYEELTETEKEYDRLLTVNLLKTIQRLGYRIIKDENYGT